MKLIQTRLLKAFTLTKDLINSLDEKDLKLTLEGLPSNTIGGQLWCIIGARQSYTKAVVAGSWQGFDCSLDDSHSKSEVVKLLDHTYQAIEDIDFEELSEEQLSIALELLEHEVQHHGQLIRYVYGNKLVFPKSWNDRYTV